MYAARAASIASIGDPGSQQRTHPPSKPRPAAETPDERRVVMGGLPADLAGVPTDVLYTRVCDLESLKMEVEDHSKSCSSVTFSRRSPVRLRTQIRMLWFLRVEIS